MHIILTLIDFKAFAAYGTYKRYEKLELRNRQQKFFFQTATVILIVHSMPDSSRVRGNLV